MRDPLLGRLIAQRYRLIARLGSGGMASVYLARHVLIERLSAIKFLRDDLGGDPVYRDRFLREARAVNRINHPNIVEITDYGEADGLVYLVMEYVPGETLGRALDRAPVGWRRAAGIGLQIASALGRAHQMGVIHRDLKPGNVMLVARKSGEDLVKLTDFGVAKMRGAPTITTSLIALGTPGYVAPEYLELGQVDGRSDLFSLGVLLYEATSGVLPFGNSENPGRGFALVPPRALAEHASDVPPFFDDVVRTLLARDPDDRPRDGFEVHDLLRRALESEGMPVLSVPGRPSEAPQLRPAGPFDETQTMSAGPPPGRRGPHLTTVAFDRVGPLCAGALSRLDRWAEAAGADGETRALEAGAESALAEARKLGQMVGEIASLVATDAEALEANEARGRAIRAELGQRMDGVARERSRALGWAGTVAERHDRVRMRRESGDAPVGAMEAMVWEQAALVHEEEKTRAHAEELSRQIERIDAELALHNETFEHEHAVLGAQLAGHVAALRSLALESWLAMQQAAKRLGRDPHDLLEPAPAELG